MNVIQKDSLISYWKKNLEQYEDNLLKQRLETEPDLDEMRQRLADFIMIAQGKDQSQINYMEQFLQDFIHQMSRATNIKVEDIKDSLYDEKHQDINLEQFRKKILQVQQLQFNNERNYLLKAFQLSH